MKTPQILTALLLVASLAAPATAQERVHKHSPRAQTQAIEGREVGGRGTAMERRLHDRPRPKRVRRANVDLRHS